MPSSIWSGGTAGVGDPQRALAALEQEVGALHEDHAALARGRLERAPRRCPRAGPPRGSSRPRASRSGRRAGGARARPPWRRGARGARPSRSRSSARSRRSGRTRRRSPGRPCSARCRCSSRSCGSRAISVRRAHQVAHPDARADRLRERGRVDDLVRLDPCESIVGSASPSKRSSTYGSSSKIVKSYSAASSSRRWRFSSESVQPAGFWKLGMMCASVGRAPSLERQLERAPRRCRRARAGWRGCSAPSFRSASSVRS